MRMIFSVGVYAFAGAELTPRMLKSLTIIKEATMRNKNLIHPGEILQKEFLAPLGRGMQCRVDQGVH
jgi:hypothetical protein